MQASISFLGPVGLQCSHIPVPPLGVTHTYTHTNKKTPEGLKRLTLVEERCMCARKMDTGYHEDGCVGIKMDIESGPEKSSEGLRGLPAQ